MRKISLKAPEFETQRTVMPNLAYIPFLEPLHLVHAWWYLLLIPLAFGISVIYKALRVLDFETFWRQVTVMTAQIVAAMLALALALVFLVEWVIPRLPVH